MTATSLRGRELFDIEITSSDELHMVVSEDNGLWLDIIGSSISGKPGREIPVPVRITNTGNNEAIVVVLHNDTLPKGWHFIMTDEPIIVMKGQTRLIQTIIVPPSDSRAGSSCILTVRGTIKYLPHIRSRASVVVEVEQVHNYNAVIYGEDLKKGLPGESLEIQIHMENYGNGDESFTFIPSLPKGWGHTILDTMNREVEEFLLDPFSAEFLRLRFKIPEDALAGKFKMLLTVEGENGEMFLPFEAEVVQVREFRLTALEGTDRIELEARINREERFRCIIENTGNGVDSVNIMIGGMGEYGALTDLPVGVNAGVSSVSQHIDQKGDPTYWNSSRPLDLTEFSHNKLFIPERKIFGGPLAGTSPITDMTIKLPPGAKAYLEFWMKQGFDEKDRAVEKNDLLVAALTDDIREILPVKVDLFYPDLHFIGTIEVVGSSMDEELRAKSGDRLSFIVKIGNRGEVNAEDVIVQLYIDEKQVTNVSLPYVPVSGPGTKIVILTWEAKAGNHRVKIVIDPGCSIVETEDLDVGAGPDENTISTEVEVKGEGFTIRPTGIISILICAGALILIVAIAVYVKNKQGPNP
jgi:hypothetical protein